VFLWHSTPVDFLLPVGNLFEDALGVVGIVLVDAFEVCLCLREKFEFVDALALAFDGRLLFLDGLPLIFGERSSRSSRSRSSSVIRLPPVAFRVGLGVDGRHDGLSAGPTPNPSTSRYHFAPDCIHVGYEGGPRKKRTAHICGSPGGGGVCCAVSSASFCNTR